MLKLIQMFENYFSLPYNNCIVCNIIYNYLGKIFNDQEISLKTFFMTMMIYYLYNACNIRIFLKGLLYNVTTSLPEKMQIVTIIKEMIIGAIY